MTNPHAVGTQELEGFLTIKHLSNPTSYTPSLYLSFKIPIQPFCCGFDPDVLTTVKAFTLLVEVGLHTFLLKFMELLTVLVAQVQLWYR